MIARQRTCTTRTADHACYLAYLESSVLEEYRETPGHRGALVLTRELGGRTEIVLLSFWESMEAVGRFAGPAPEKPVFHAEDDRFLVARDSVQHYKVDSDEHAPDRGSRALGAATVDASRFLLMRE